MSQPTAPHGTIMQRIEAFLNAHGGRGYERLMADRKRALLAPLRGAVVEIGPGAGANFPHFAPDIRWVGLEPNPHMHRYLDRRAKAHGIVADSHVGGIPDAGLPEASADAVVSTLVLCSVPDLPAALADIRRMLRPGGRFVFVEHVCAQSGSRLRRWQERLNSLHQRLPGGCSLTRDIALHLDQAGFRELTLERFEVNAGLIRPHIAGIATR